MPILRAILAICGVVLSILVIVMGMHELRGYLLILASLICLEQGVNELRQRNVRIKRHQSLLGWLKVSLSVCLVYLAVDSFALNVPWS
jgi:hypothetical protein